MSLNSWLVTSNAVFFLLTGLALVVSIAIFLLTRANDRAKDRELRRLQFEAEQVVAKATATAEAAKAEAAEANRATAEANLKIEQLRATNLQWQASVTPRKFRNFPFSSSLFDINKVKFTITSANDPEAVRFAAEIFSGMRSAGFNVVGPYTMMTPDLTNPGYGVDITGRIPRFDKHSLTIEDPLDDIWKIFDNQGILARRRSSITPVIDNQVTIAVGVKPWPGVPTEDRQRWPGPLKEIPSDPPAEPVPPR